MSHETIPWPEASEIVRTVKRIIEWIEESRI